MKKMMMSGRAAWLRLRLVVRTPGASAAAALKAHVYFYQVLCRAVPCPVAMPWAASFSRCSISA